MKYIYDKYNQIILIEQDIPAELVSKIVNYIESRHIKNVLLVTSEEKLAACNSDLILGMDSNEYKELLRRYRIYEFSDRVILLSKDNNYGSLFNYVDTGLITEDEMIAAILE